MEYEGARILAPMVRDILKTLRRNLQLPVSCKIRLLDDPRDTVELARRLSACGICALAVHGRTTQQRPSQPASWEGIKTVVSSLPGVPIIANGDLLSYGDAERVRSETGCAAAMYARGAMWNASVFRPQGFLPLDEVQRDYVRLALRWDNALPNTKYCLKEMADAPVPFAGRRGGPRSLVGHEGNVAATRAKDARLLCALMGLGTEPPYEDLGDAACATARTAPAAAPAGGSAKAKQPPKRAAGQAKASRAAGVPAPAGAAAEHVVVPLKRKRDEGEDTHEESGRAGGQIQPTA
ncbi:tRNA-dihydrouridine(20) synthase [NAD(P)+]-like [Tetrabaena socialis]|uniref:tRNA-dihydrouridine(20) synthase [NAD(P)+]-like n=1 Tax=Tetrabaena socialis TaxID=47790 RepID=A0A2J8AF71_9CHLO|nr:tRNA-dihydrouridine(20) synthase [NAD(P)+]-like [Tetrabaena socialis]|eukprot:PNH11160.1 tRNA-dihydrouridine(20) synthase [NAD(P)+]-like [Tetrabaena socialis]